MYRNHLKTMGDWFEQPSHKPLVLRGARQVGKSTLVGLFAEQQKIELVELNFERNPEYAELFSTKDPKGIVANIRLMLNKNLLPEQSILFLDEIQAVPKVLACLRYFYEEMPLLHVVAAGSLLDFELAEPEFSMPVGRISYMHMYPMSFTEFLCAVGEKALAEYVEQWQVGDEIIVPVHDKLMGLLRQNMAVGGMPEAVKDFSQSSDYRRCEVIKQDLMATFQDDFAKYARHQDQDLIRLCFRKAPAFIGRKVKYSEISRDANSQRVGKALEQLNMARVVHKVMRTSANGLPLAAEENVKFFKLLFLDVGLISTMMNVSWQVLQQDLMLINQGVLAEQWVGQELLNSLDAHQPPHLHYWARESRSSSAEVDYVIAGDKAIPVEVKAGKTGSLKSLHLFVKEKSSALAIRLNADQPSLMQIDQQEGIGCSLLSLPLYMAGQVRRLVAENSL
ncbi:MAG: AAA family ATPase [Mariprofundus sp.]|nr:AAA family ATPase [Mariprofundus sp.]